jgi:hypothetical protein
MDPGVDPRIAQLLREGTAGTTWPRVHPYSCNPPTGWLNPTAEKGPQKVRARQPYTQ